MWSKKVSGGPQSTLKPRGRGRGSAFGSAGGSSRNSSSEHLPISRNQGGHKPKAHKSADIQRIEGLIGAIEDGISDLPSGGGCFCMARKHGLSPYTPICSHCGLVLCASQNPAAPCPFCQSPLLSPNERNIVLVKLLAEKEEILRKEELFRHQEELQIQQLREIAQGGGAFPTLGPKAGSGTSTPHDQTPVQEPATRKVLSLTGRGGGTTLTTYAPKPPPSAARSKPPTPKVLSAEELAEIERQKPIPCPPTEVPFVQDAPLDKERPWKDLRGAGLVYIPPEPEPSTITEDANQQQESSKGKKKGKAKKPKPDGRSVPGAAPS